MSKTQNIACRISPSDLSAVDADAKNQNLTRSEWLQIAIARQLGKRPQLPLAARVTKLEKVVGELVS
jgi:hypothetical protein